MLSLKGNTAPSRLPLLLGPQPGVARSSRSPSRIDTPNHPTSRSQFLMFRSYPTTRNIASCFMRGLISSFSPAKTRRRLRPFSRFVCLKTSRSPN